jgi:hypothetical protein
MSVHVYIRTGPDAKGAAAGQSVLVPAVHELHITPAQVPVSPFAKYASGNGDGALAAAAWPVDIPTSLPALSGCGHRSDRASQRRRLVDAWMLHMRPALPLLKLAFHVVGSRKSHPPVKSSHLPRQWHLHHQAIEVHWAANSRASIASRGGLVGPKGPDR